MTQLDKIQEIRKRAGGNWNENDFRERTNCLNQDFNFFIGYSRCHPVPFSKQAFPWNEWGDSETNQSVGTSEKMLAGKPAF